MQDAAPMTLRRPEGEVLIRELGGGLREVRLRPREPDTPLPVAAHNTTLPVDFIEALLDGGVEFAWLCEALSRYDETSATGETLRRQLFSHVPPEDFRGKRMLDFGCGGGPSTVCLATALPETEIVGLDLSEARIRTASRLVGWRGLKNMTFRQSPTPGSIPADLGDLDFIMLSAVYEHLLPAERRALMPALWRALRPGGLLFVNLTPFRWSPYEHHTTELWLVNYLPDRLAHLAARRFSRANPKLMGSANWEDLLRAGIRGGTERGIIAEIRGGTRAEVEIVQPRHGGVRDRADYWLQGTSPSHRWLKRALASAFRASDRLWGVVPSASIDLVLRKVA